MTTSRTLWIAGCLLLATCGDDAPQQAPDGHRVVAVIDADRMADASVEHPLTGALRTHPGIAAVFAHDETIATGAVEACAAAQRTDVRIVSGLANAADARQLVADGRRAAACACTAAPAAAIDLALLVCSGITAPKDLGLGVQRFTRADLAAGGVNEAAPGDFVLDTLRRQHADTLTTTPAIDVVFRIGLVDGGAFTAGGTALRALLVAAAKRYPQVQLDVGPDTASPEQQQATARKFIGENYNALLVVPTAPEALVKVCAEATAQNIKVVVLGNALAGDAFLCRIGADPTALGRAAAAAMKQVLPAGGDVVEVQGNDRAAAAACHDAFVRALGSKAR